MKILLALLLSAALINCSHDNSSPSNNVTNNPKGGGNEGANGGDRVAQSAAAVALEVVSLVEKAPTAFPEIQILELRAAVNRVKVIAVNNTYANGTETDASNNGLDQINVSRTRWGQITDHRQQLALIFHELLSIIGVEKNNYAVSGRILKSEFRFVDKQIYFYQTDSYQSCWFSISWDASNATYILEPLMGMLGQYCDMLMSGPALFRMAGGKIEPYPRLSSGDQTHVSELFILDTGELLMLNSSAASRKTCRPALAPNSPQSIEVKFSVIPLGSNTIADCPYEAQVYCLKRGYQYSSYACTQKAGEGTATDIEAVCSLISIKEN